MNRICLLMGLVFVHVMTNAQSLPNGSFETWTTTGGYSEPTPWNTPNPTTAALGTYTVIKETGIVKDGTASAKVQTKSVLGFQIPGLMTLGTFSINLATMEAKIEGGVPFSWRPDSLKGFLQYEPKFGDECFVGVLMLKQIGSAWDTIGSGTFTSTNTLLSWTPFSLPIHYNSTETPTHLNVIILSSDRNNPQPNSTLYIDQLSFVYQGAAIGESPESAPSIVYAGEQLVISNVSEQVHTLEVHILSPDGRLIAKTNLANQGTSPAIIPLAVETSGVYLVRILMNGDRQVTKKLLIHSHKSH
jgi:hypothetical protein